MNQIKRDVYILSDKIKDPIDYVQNTNAIPIVFTLRDYDISSGSTAQIFVLKPSGKSVYNAAEISDNIVTVNVTTQMFSEVGVSALQIQISNSGKNLVTFEYPVRVHKNNTDPDAAESENESSFFKDLQDAANAANQAADNANDTAQSIQQAADDGDFSSTITIGNTTTGEPGTQAEVTNTGTAKDPVFNFTIPQGPVGPRGPAGNINDIEDATVTFSQASSRTNINSGDSIGTLFGKIRKWFADLGTAAFQGVSNVLTQTSDGYVLDARQGKTLADRIGTLSSLLTTAKTSLVNAVNELFNKIGDLADLATTEKGDVVGAINEINAGLSDKEPTQKRTTLDSIYYKNGYDCHLHCASDNAEDVIITLPADYRPRSAATVAGFCENISSGGFYPCIGAVLSDGTWAYVSALNEIGQSTPYYIYNKNQSIDKRSNFRLWLGGSWSTNTNGS